jgi:hypothetical protein
VSLTELQIQNRGLKEIISGSDHRTALAARVRARLDRFPSNSCAERKRAARCATTSLPPTCRCCSSWSARPPSSRRRIPAALAPLPGPGDRRPADPRPAPAPAAGPKPRRARRCRAHGARTGRLAADKPHATLTGRILRRRQLARRCHSSSCRSCTTSRSSSATRPARSRLNGGAAGVPLDGPSPGISSGGACRLFASPHRRPLPGRRDRGIPYRRSAGTARSRRAGASAPAQPGRNHPKLMTTGHPVIREGLGDD